MDVTGQLNILKKELQGKDKLTADMVDNVRAFKVNLRLSTKCVRVHLRLQRQTFQP